MKRTIAALLFCLASSSAYADVVSDRVVLIPAGGTACGSGQQTFKRLYESPTGTSTTDSTEFRVPSGMYLDVASIEYTLPRSTRFTKLWTQYLEVDIRPRTTSYGHRILNAPFALQNVVTREADDTFVSIGDAVEPASSAYAISFPAGPLMGSQARVCAKASSNFWNYGGAVKIRGKLIPTGGPIFESPTDSTNKD